MTDSTKCYGDLRREEAAKNGDLRREQAGKPARLRPGVNKTDQARSISAARRRWGITVPNMLAILDELRRCGSYKRTALALGYTKAVLGNWAKASRNGDARFFITYDGRPDWYHEHVHAILNATMEAKKAATIARHAANREAAAAAALAKLPPETPEEYRDDWLHLWEMQSRRRYQATGGELWCLHEDPPPYDPPDPELDKISLRGLRMARQQWLAEIAARDAALEAERKARKGLRLKRKQMLKSKTDELSARKVDNQTATL